MSRKDAEEIPVPGVDDDNIPNPKVDHVNRMAAAGILGVEDHILEKMTVKHAINLSKDELGWEKWRPEHIAKAFCILASRDGKTSRHDYADIARRKVNPVLIKPDSNEFKNFFSSPEWKEVVKRAKREHLSFEGTSFVIDSKPSGFGENPTQPASRGRKLKPKP